MAKGGTHEDYIRTAEVTVGSERSFGFVFTAFFALVALAPLRHGQDVRLWAVGVAVAFAIVALAAPRLLRPLNLLWFRFGMLLHHVVTPVVMGLLFFVALTPVGLLMRATGKDPMRLRREANATSYWIVRQPPGPAPETMKHQF